MHHSYREKTLNDRESCVQKVHAFAVQELGATRAQYGISRKCSHVFLIMKTSDEFVCLAAFRIVEVIVIIINMSIGRLLEDYTDG